MVVVNLTPMSLRAGVRAEYWDDPLNLRGVAGHKNKSLDLLLTRGEHYCDAVNACNQTSVAYTKKLCFAYNKLRRLISI